MRQITERIKIPAIPYVTGLRTPLVLILIVLFLILCVLAAGLAYFLWTGSQAQQPDRPTRTLQPSSTPLATSAPDADAVWQRMQASGKMRVGVSADYPPFESVGADFSLTGYDIALAQEIARRLSLQVEFSNQAFDGLINAVQLGQIDVAISALSVTPERQAQVDFSNTYYFGQDAALTLAAAPLQVNAVSDLAGYIVGVQTGSVYESWLRGTLVQPGAMPPQNLVTFPTVAEAAAALSAAPPRIHLVILDEVAANQASVGKPYKIVAKGLYPQSYAVAFPKRNPTLAARLNAVLAAMQQDGTLTRLAQQYLNISQPPPPPPPTATPISPPVPPTPQPCLDGMTFVADINYPDNNMQSPQIVSPGQVIQKGWRIRNSGSCTWDASYQLRYTGGNPANSQVGGSSVPVSGVVPPGGTYDVYANLTAPALSGIYQSFWALHNGRGQNFGQRIWAGFQVVAAVTPTFGPSQPQITSFTSIPTTIQAGQCVNLQWQYAGQNLTLVRLFRNGELILSDLPLTGQSIDCPQTAGQMDYRLVLDAQGGGSATAALTVMVSPRP